MSELIQKNDNRATIRWKLLTGVSVLALTAYVSSVNVAKAEDASRPTIWIELGGQMEMMQGTSTPFTAPFMSTAPNPDFYKTSSFTENQKPPLFTFGENGKITFQPEGSDWIFSAGIHYGRSHTKRHVHYQTHGQTKPIGIYSNGVIIPSYYRVIRTVEAFSDTKALYSEHHLVLDFSVGKDVGIGLLGHDGTSNVNAGVRSVDFTQSSTVTIYARPEVGFVNRFKYPFYIPGAEFDQYSLTGHAQRSFKGIGPSVSWNASATIAGDAQSSELMVDWGINAALLFGKQKAKTDHSTNARYYNQKYGGYYPTPLYPPRVRNNPVRSRSVAIPNVGGFAGLSLKWENAKITLGYRGDIFFKAIDRGIDARKDSNLTFNGPYASISIGLGD